jgi:hypothetical protein
MSRTERRIEAGLTNPVPSSTKISKHTPAPKKGTFNAYRTNRFGK